LISLSAEAAASFSIQTARSILKLPWVERHSQYVVLRQIAQTARFFKGELKIPVVTKIHSLRSYLKPIRGRAHKDNAPCRNNGKGHSGIQAGPEAYSL
jgi:hypothetical protein